MANSTEALVCRTMSTLRWWVGGAFRQRIWPPAAGRDHERMLSKERPGGRLVDHRTRWSMVILALRFWRGFPSPLARLRRIV